MHIKPKGFEITFTKKADKASVETIASYKVSANTWIYQQGYGSPNVDVVTPEIKSIKMAADGMSAYIELDKIHKGHTYNFEFPGIRSTKGKTLLHSKAFYTVNEVLGEEHLFDFKFGESDRKKKK